MKFLLGLLLFLQWTPCSAEYRVFLLDIRHVDKGTSRQAVSILDQYQYPEYHPVSPRELVVVKDHWLCPGRTFGHQPPCASPRSQDPQPPDEPGGSPEGALRSLASPPQ